MKSKVVSQYNGTHLIAKYSTVALASELNDVQPSHVGKVANGLRNTAGGFRWRFPKTVNLSRGLSSVNRGIGQIDVETGEIVAVYESIDMASTITGFRRASINNSTTKLGRSAGGFGWVVL